MHRMASEAEKHKREALSMGLNAKNVMREAQLAARMLAGAPGAVRVPLVVSVGEGEMGAVPEGEVLGDS